MKCYSCGYTNPSHARFCSGCGAALAGEPTPSGATPNPYRPGSAPGTLSGAETGAGLSSRAIPSVGQHLIGHLLEQRYQLLEMVGQGGMGSVYLAEDTRMQRKVVVKFPHAALMADPRFAERFQRELKTMVSAHHPGVVRALDCGYLEALPYVVLEYLDGGTLEQFLGDAEHPVSPESLLDWLPQVADALDALHRHGIVHRDIKPGNILLDQEGRTYLADFGIAKAMGEQSALTKTGMMAGSPHYMAPEQAAGSEVGGAVDQYSLATILYRMLVGSLPFRADNPIKILMLKQETKLDVHKACPHLPIAVARVLQRALDPDPGKRFDSCQELAHNYQQAVLGRGAGKRGRIGLLLGVLVLLLGLCGGLYLVAERQGWLVDKQDDPNGSPEISQSTLPADSLTGPVSSSGPAIDDEPEPVAADNTPPQLAFTDPAEQSWLQPGRIRFTLEVDAAESVRVAGLLARKDAQTGQYLAELDLLSESTAKLITAEAWDQAGNLGVATLIVNVDGTPPQVKIVGLERDFVFDSRSPEILIEVHDPQLASLSIAGELEPLRADGRYPKQLSIAEDGPWTLVVEAVDLAGNRARSTLLGSVDSQAAGVLEATAEALGSSIRVCLLADEPLAHVEAEGLARQELSGSSLEVQLADAGQQSIELQLTDRAGHKTFHALDVQRPDPEPRGARAIEAWWTPPPAQSEAGHEAGLPSAIENDLAMRFVLVPAGRFAMGSDAFPAHAPHDVVLSRNFYLKSTEVTQAEYRRVMGAEPSEFAANGEDAPVESLSWFDAVRFCNRLSELDGLEPAYAIDGPEQVRFLGLDRSGYRLPSEAEWEYACRAGTQTRYAVGDALSEAQACFSQPADSGPVPVGSHPANPWGLFDMHGNVWEWCGDWYGDYPVRATDPLGPQTGDNRVLRGGSWQHDAQRCMSAYRSRVQPGMGNGFIGFRIARSMPVE